MRSSYTKEGVQLTDVTSRRKKETPSGKLNNGGGK